MRPNLPKTTFVNVVISFSYHFVKNYAKRGLSKFVRARGTSYAAHLRPGIISQSLDYQPLPTLTNRQLPPSPLGLSKSRVSPIPAYTCPRTQSVAWWTSSVAFRRFSFSLIRARYVSIVVSPRFNVSAISLVVLPFPIN